MFNPLKTEVVGRFAGVESYFKDTNGLQGDSAQVAKGIAFVQMYAAYEYTVVTVVQTAIDAIIAHGHLTKNLTPSLMALFLDPELQSVRSSSFKSEWENRLGLFQRVFSTKLAEVRNTVLPIDGSHFRASQLKLIFEVLGIGRTPAQRRRHLDRINEIVNNRNAVAHGRETAENVGRRYSRSDIIEAIRQTKSVCLLLISAIEKHCTDPTRHCRS